MADEPIDDEELLAWIENDPDNWELPDELRMPASGIVENFAIIVLSSRFTSAAINQSVGRLITDSAEFSTWFFEEAKGQENPLRLLQLSETSMRLLRPCWKAWKVYERAYEENSTEFPSVEAQNLLAALDAAHNGFRTPRGL
ncbi:hypothetical protein [Streptomyces genisteinicus]|uniref:Uncharacterized protein n=1 Tax=Streptomyces genisteinicus TaxID=2768068 RepID=A0A7H0HPN3_9ACTN|nr:hypothetical protein [Streptomyces genisteinicus]QNP62499.1 hypothetical protein IAG43_05800 [Streptomyces genisteinicus]